MEKGRSDFKILTGKPTGRRLPERPKRRRENSFKINLVEITVNARNWNDTSEEKIYWKALM